MQRFEQIYERHADAVRAYVRRRAPESLVDDVVADVFVVALRRLEDVPRDALPWLYAVARKTLANERRKRRDVPVGTPEASYEPEPVGDSQLAAAFAALSDADREILRLVACDVMSRLAAANPVPREAPARRPLRRRRVLLAAVALGVLVPAAIAVADEIGISNGGTPVPLDSVPLGPALQELKVGGTMQYLGTLNNVAFYATRNADGRFCMAVDHVDQQYEKGVGCDLRPDGFPSPQVRVMTFPAGGQLQGIATDGVATVQALDAAGNVLDSTPVVNNLFASSTNLDGSIAAIRALDANGTVLTTQRLPGK